MAIYFFSDPPNILLGVGIGIGYKISVKLKFSVQPMHQIYSIKYCILKTIVYQNENELTGTSVVFTMIVSRFEKSCCPLKSSAPLSWQPNLVKTLPTGAISKLMIQTREAIPKYTLLDPVSLLWTWHFKHGVHATNFPSPY